MDLRREIQFLLISKPASLLRLCRGLIVSSASRNLHLKWCFSLAITFVSLRHMWWFFLPACSTKVEEWALSLWMYTLFSLSLIFTDLPASPIYYSPQEKLIMYIAFCWRCSGLSLTNFILCLMVAISLNEVLMYLFMRALPSLSVTPWIYGR